MLTYDRNTVTQTDRPKSVHNCCVIEVLVAFLCCHVAFFGFFCGCRGFYHRTESSFPFSLKLIINNSNVILVSFEDVNHFNISVLLINC